MPMPPLSLSLSQSSLVIATTQLSFITLSLTTTFPLQVLSLSHYMHCGFCFVKNDKLNQLFELSTGTGKRRPSNFSFKTTICILQSQDHFCPISFLIPCDYINKNFMIETLRSKFLAIGGMYVSYKFEVLYENQKAGEGFHAHIPTFRSL